MQPSADEDGVGSVSIPFEEFLPRWRGYDRTGTLDLTALSELSFQLLFQDGPFTLRLKEISLVDTIAPPVDPAPAVDPTPTAVRAAIDAATSRADYLVGKGYAAQAAVVLAATARAVSTTLAGVNASRAQEALAAATAQAAEIVATDEPGRVRALLAGFDLAKAAAAGDAWPTPGDPDTDSGQDATDKNSTDDGSTATGGRDGGGSKKKKKSGDEWPVVLGVVLALLVLAVVGVGAALWSRGARKGASKSPAAAADEETEEPLQVV